MKCDLKMAERPLAPQSHSIAEEPWSLEVTGDTKQAAQEIKDGRKAPHHHTFISWFNHILHKTATYALLQFS